MQTKHVFLYLKPLFNDIYIFLVLAKCISSTDEVLEAGLYWLIDFQLHFVPFENFSLITEVTISDEGF